MTDPRLNDLSVALKDRGVKSLVYHSGGGCMVVAVYPDDAEHETSDGQYGYRYMVGIDEDETLARKFWWGWDHFDAEGEYDDSGVLNGTTIEEVADEVAALPRASDSPR